jgi:hypothetical protein
VHELIHGRWQAEVVRAVLELRIPDLLGNRTREIHDLAVDAGADHDRLHRLMVLAVALGLFTEAWDNLDHAVRHGTSGFPTATGRDVFAFLAENPDEASDFHAFQAQVTGRNVAALLAAHEFPPAATVVDVGGGDGALLRAVLRRHPGVHGILLDRAEAVAQARASVQGECPADRLTLVEGDFFDKVPAGGDVYVLSHILHDWADPPAARILGRVAEAMEAGAYLLVVENVKDDEPNLLVDYLDVLMLTAWGSRERTAAQYGSLLGEAGLEVVDVRILEPRSRLAALTARRPAAVSPSPAH